MEVTERSVVSGENYKQIKEMLIGNDEASKTVALTILEQSDYEQSEIYVMLVLKDAFRTAFGTAAKFKELSPVLADKVTKSLKEEDIEIAKLSFKEIYDLAMKRNIQEEIDFILMIFQEQMYELFSDMGYQFVNYTEVLVKPKGWFAAQELKMLKLEQEVAKLKEGVLNA